MDLDFYDFAGKSTKFYHYIFTLPFVGFIMSYWFWKTASLGIIRRLPWYPGLILPGGVKDFPISLEGQGGPSFPKGI